MANIRKQFNFRNGIQIDDDNLVVSSLGLVGIGTTIPTEILDVRGTTKIVGLATIDQIYTSTLTANNVTISNLALGDSIIGGGVSVRSGIITGSNSGVVTYYGDGGRLLNLPTSQWLDIDVGLGFTSIYAQGYVGVGTVDPRFLFQISGTPNTSLVGFTSGVGFSSEGNILATGIVTAYKFSGIGSNLTQLNASSIEYGTISNDRLPIINNDRLSSNISVSGIITAQTKFDGNLTGNVYSTGISTFTRLRSENSLQVGSMITADATTGILTANTFVGGLVGIASTARGLTGTPDITVARVVANSVNVGFSTAGISTVYSAFHIGQNGSSLSIDSDGKVGINSSIPDREFQIFKNGSSSIEIVGSDSAEIIIGQNKTNLLGIGNSTGSIRFGSSSKSFDLINNDAGNFNFILHRAVPIVGVQTGRFDWIYGQTNDEIMSLTYDGKLGIGITNPQRTLEVVGTSTVTSDAYFGNDVFIENGLTVATLTIQGDIVNTNINNGSGISTFFNLRVSNNFFNNNTNSQAFFNEIGIGTDIIRPDVTVDADGATFVMNKLGVGITITSLQYGLDAENDVIEPDVQISQRDVLLLGSNLLLVGSTNLSGSGNIINPVADGNFTGCIGLNTAFPRCVADFSNPGIAATVAGYLLPPRITTIQRSTLQDLSIQTGTGTTAEGAIIFNSTNKEFQGYSNNNWINLGITTSVIETTQINVSGISTFAGITTVTGETLFAKQLNVSGVATASQIKVGTGVTISAGIVTATNGFLSGIGTAVQISTVGDRLVFTVPGVGSTSFILT